VVEDVPIQFFQSVVAIELAVTGALFFQVRYFSPREGTAREDVRLPSATLRLAIAIVLGATVARTDEQGRYVLVTVVGVIAYVVLVAAAITLVEL
jgi:hypothetical protein